MALFVRHWRLWWRRWSTWGAALNAAFWAHITAKSGMLLGFVPLVPPQYRMYAVAATFLVTFVAPVLLTQLRQPKLAEQARNAAP